MNWNLEKLRLQAADTLKDVSNGQLSKLARGMKDVPVARMIDAVNYIDKNLLPAIKKKSGDKSADFEFFTNVIDHLLWAIAIADRYDSLEAKWAGQRLEIQILREHVERLEKELGKYTTLEDLILTASLDVYAERVKKAAEDRLKNK
jgi:hypothetical protein